MTSLVAVAGVDNYVKVYKDRDLDCWWPRSGQGVRGR